MKKRAANDGELSGSPAPRPAWWLEAGLLALLLAACFAARWPFRDVVLIRDEGEYVHLGQEILRGRVPYLDIYNQKTPLVFYLMAGVQKVAGTSLEAVRVFTSLYGLAAALVVYLLARRLFGRRPDHDAARLPAPMPQPHRGPARQVQASGPAALGAALAFCVMTFDQCGVHHQASTEFFMLLWLAGAVYFWYLGRGERRRIWPALLAGAAAGLAYQTKQTGLVLLGFFPAEALLWWLRERRSRPGAWRDAAGAAALALAGFAVVLAAVLGYYASRGALGAYIECTWTNNWQYVAARPGMGADPVRYFSEIAGKVARWDIVLWLFGAVGLAGLALRGRGQGGRDLWLLLAATAAAAVKTGQVYVHYYEPLIVPLSLGCGAAVGWLWRRAAGPSVPRAGRLLAALLLAAPWVWPAAHGASYLIMNQAQRSALRDVFAPFPAAVEAGRYLAEHTAPGEPVLVVGSEPEIYYYADRPAACRMAIVYPMTGPYSYAARLRREFMDQWAGARPRYVALVTIGESISEWRGGEERFGAQVAPVLDRYYVPEAVFPRARGAEGGGEAELLPCILVFKRAAPADGR